MSEIERLENDIAKLSIHIPADAFKAAVEKAYHKNAGRYPVPGFRKGKAPRKFIESNYGPVFYDEAFDACWSAPYGEAVKEHDLTPVDQPSVEITSISEETGIDFTATVQLQPTVTLGAYKGIEIVKQTANVTDDEVATALESERQAQARFIDVERPVHDGDKIVLDYAGTVDGVAFDGGTAQDQDLTIGSGTFIPGFEEQLIGAVAGEDRDVKVTFPAEYHAKDLAGKDAVFACKVKAVQEKQLPEIDDEFIKDISEFDTIDQWKENKKAELLKSREQNARISMENDAIAKVTENASCNVPECMIERQVNYMVQDMAYRLQQSGISMDDYFKYLNTDMDKVKAMYRPDAENRIKSDLVLNEIRKVENIEATEEDVEKQYDLFCAQNGMKKEDLLKSLSEDDKAYFADRACVEKTVDFLMANIVLVDAPAPEAKEEEKTEDAE